MSLDEVTTFSQYLEEKIRALHLTNRAFMQLIGIESGRFSRLFYQNMSPTISEVYKIAEQFNDDPIWVLMLSRRLTPDMEEYLFSNYEVFRNIYVRSKNKFKKVS